MALPGTCSMNHSEPPVSSVTCHSASGCTAECIVLFSNRSDPKYKIHLSFGQRYQQRVQYLFLVFSNNKIRMITLYVNGSPGEWIVRFGLYLSWHSKWVLYIGTLLEGTDTALETHFGFEFREGSLVGDSLKDLKAGGLEISYMSSYFVIYENFEWP
jgi:hypothetical protein